MHKDPFTLYLRVRYGECDAQQVVFNARYADYVDIAGTEFLRALPGGYQGLLQRGLDTQVVNLTLNWFSPARFDDVLKVTVSTSHLGTTSYRLQMVFYRDADHHKLATADITYVMVDNKRFQKTPIPDDLRLAIESAGAGIVVDQSGRCHC